MKVYKVTEMRKKRPVCYHCHKGIKRLVAVSQNCLTYHPGCLRRLIRRGVPERWL
jgi:hypothetical protein